MRNRISLILLCGVLQAAPREEARRDFQKTAPLPGGRTLRIEHSLGSVNVRTHAANEVRIAATIRCSGRTAGEARNCTDRILINVDESPSGISVRTEYPRNSGRNNLSFGADYEILMPASSPLDVRNRFGSVTVTNLQAEAVINNTNGSVTFSGGKGRQRLENSFGNVDVQRNNGDVTIRNGNGNVTARDVTGVVDVTNRFGSTNVTGAGRGLTIHSNNGNIEALNVTGITTITNTFGRVTLTDAKGDATLDNQNGAIQATGITGAANLHTTFDRINASRIGKSLVVRATNASIIGDTIGDSATVETTFGSVDLRGVKGFARVTSQNGAVRLMGVGGEAFVRSTFAGVDLTDVAGPITVESQNGHIVAETRPGQRCQPVSLSTTFSPIRVMVPAGMGYNVTARTSFGRVHSELDLTISGEISQGALSGKVNGGGCEMRLTGQNGNIDIVRAK